MGKKVSKDIRSHVSDIYTYLYRLECIWQAAQGTINHGHWAGAKKKG